MFYADFVLSKKGPLSRIWLAAHWDRKITKSQVFETNIEKSVEGILQPSVKMALRTSGHLLLGVVRIYSRKAKYLLADCNEAFVKIKMAFRPGMVDLPEDHREAAVSAVTLPEVFHDFDPAMPDFKFNTWNDVDIEVQFNINQSRMDEITLREEFGNLPNLVQDDDFGEDGFDTGTSEVLRQSTNFDHGLNQTNLFYSDGMDHALNRPSTSEMNSLRRNSLGMGIGMDEHRLKDDGFGDVPAGGLFEGSLFDDTPMSEVPIAKNDPFQISSRSEPMEVDNIPSFASPKPSSSGQQQPMPSGMSPRINDYDDDDDDHFIPPSPGGASSDGSRPASPIAFDAASAAAAVAPLESGVTASPSHEITDVPLNDLVQESPRPEPTEQQAVDANREKDEHEHENEINDNADQTTLINNDEGTFALLPVDASVIRGLAKTKRKRKLIVDEVKNISGEEMKSQLSDTSDIVTTLDLAPPTKRLMHWKETGGVEKLFALPGKTIPARVLSKNYQRHLTSRASLNEEGVEDHGEALLENVKENIPPGEHDVPAAAPAPSRRGRKRKQPVVEEIHPEEVPKEEIVVPPVKRLALSPPQEIAPVVENVNDDRLPLIDSGSYPPVNEAQSPVQQTDMQKNNDVPEMLPNEIATPLEPQENNLIAQSERIPQVHTEILPEAAAVSSPFHISDPSISSPKIISASPNQSCLNDEILAPASVPPTLLPPIEEEEENIVQKNGPSDPFFIETEQLPPPFPNTMENMGYDQADDNMGFEDGSQMNPNATPWHDDYYENPSIGPTAEQGENETVEQFEERLLNKRAGHLYNSIRMRMCTESKTTFSDLVKGNPCKQVAQKFYSLLVLKKHRVLDLSQEIAYGDITLSRGSNFDDPKL